MGNWTATTRRRVRAFLAVAKDEWAPGYVEAKRLLDLTAERKPIAKRLPGVSRSEARGARRLARQHRWDSVRAAALWRDGGKCVVCGDAAHDAHHLLYGAGMRQVHESLETVASTCRAHHDAAHAGRESTLEALLLWSRAHGYALAVKALIRRLDKIEARASKRANGGTT